MLANNVFGDDTCVPAMMHMHLFGTDDRVFGEDGCMLVKRLQLLTCIHTYLHFPSVLGVSHSCQSLQKMETTTKTVAHGLQQFDQQLNTHTHTLELLQLNVTIW